MPLTDERPKIELSADEKDRLRKRLDEMIQEAEAYRKSNEWDELHSLYWRMHRSDPVSKVRTWPWDNASNLFIPLVQVADNATVAHEFDAMLAQDPKVVGFEASDQADAEAASEYYFSYFFKQVMPLHIWGTDFLLNTVVDGTAAMKVRQAVEFEVRREESLEPYAIPAKTITETDAMGMPMERVVPESQGFRWVEKASVERIDETTGEVADLESIFVAPQTGTSLQWPDCRWYYTVSEVPWEDMIERRRSWGYKFSDDELKPYLAEAEPTEKKQMLAEREGVDTRPPKTVRVVEFYMRWPLPSSYKVYTDEEPLGTDEKQEQGDEEGYWEETVVTYAPSARHILLVRPLSRICPDGKRPHVDMRYRRIPGCFYGVGVPSELRDLQAGINISWNQMVDFGTLANTPWMLYSPANAGMLPENGSIAPGSMVQVNDPRGVFTPTFRMDPNFYFGTNSAIQAWAEKVANVSDIQLGRAPTTPNAPRTARGQMAMIQMGNIGFSILTAIHSESFIAFFKRIHAFKKRYAKPEEAFRVLNKQSGMFERRTIKDRAFQADVDFQFQINPNRQADQQRAQAMYSMVLSGVQQAIANPLLEPMIRQLSREAAVAMGAKNFDQIWPQDLMARFAVQNMANASQGQPQQPQIPGGNGQGAPAPSAPPPAGAAENGALTPMKGTLQ